MQEISNKILSPADRLFQFIENQGITKYKFHKKIGVSNGFLDKAKEIRSDNLRKILDSYPIINPEWLLTGNGEMLIESKSIKPGIDIKNERSIEEMIASLVEKKINNKLKLVLQKLQDIDCTLSKIFIGQTIQAHKEEVKESKKEKVTNE